MPVEIRPLFRPDAIRPLLTAFQLPSRVDACRPKLNHWRELLDSGRADQLNEKELLPDFLTDIFGELLGFSGPASGGDHYTMSREKHVVVDGKYADAVLGRFAKAGQRFVVAVEGKSSKDPLDRPFAGRKKSAVDQALGYAVNLRCDWYIVTSMRQTRLYHKGSDQSTFELFRTMDLATDEYQLRRFVFLLGAERIVGPGDHCHLPDLLKVSEKIGKELTRDFYVRYAEMRQNAFEQLCTENPSESQNDLLSATQKLLDRILFCAFCEDRTLLPEDTIHRAYEHRDPYHPRPIWDNFRGLFRAIDEGNAGLKIPKYNGGLFALDPMLDNLKLTDTVCGYFRELSDYDYRPANAVSAEGETAGQLVDVDILGHIFEQSITDLERLRNELEGRVEPTPREKLKTRRKKEGAFYTPAFITRYIVEQALGSVIQERFEELRRSHETSAKATAKTALADPAVYELDKLKKPQRDALVKFWEAWQDELKTIRVLDPACGSGAFLIEAFNHLHRVYRSANARLDELRGYAGLFDLDRQILQENLYGVDLNDEAIEICRLSLWIKTAVRDKVLTSLDHTICVGNSVVSDPAVHPKAFDWQSTFPEVFADGGFDVVIGNPPYVRQEWISDIKPYLQANYQAFNGLADLYVYFYELGLRVLKPGGRLSFVVTNKWMKAGYAEPLRRLFQESSWIESVVDFGHAKQIFPDADVFPSIIVLVKPNERPKPRTSRLVSIPRDQLRVDDLSRQIESEGSDLPVERLTADSWQLEPHGVTELLEKIRARGLPLSEYLSTEPLSGIKTGFNAAYTLDSETKNQIIAADPGCQEILRPYLRGQDFNKWSADWNGLWMIALRSSENFHWEWSDEGDEAEAVFRKRYPAIANHLSQFRAELTNRQDQGRYWWELRSCAYWDAFDAPKIMYPEITWRAEWVLDTNRTLCNNTAYILPSDDLWILCVANSPLMWWYSWRTALHGKDEALRFIKDFSRRLPIAKPSKEIRQKASEIAKKMIEESEKRRQVRISILDWLRMEYEIEKPSLKLQNPIALDSDGFVAEVKKLRGKSKPLSAAALKALRDEDVQTLAPARKLATEAATLERQISDLVNEAYDLTPEEVALMWETAPPRMPIAPPA